jgi:hypothetical protein
VNCTVSSPVGQGRQGLSHPARQKTTKEAPVRRIAALLTLTALAVVALTGSALAAAAGLYAGKTGQGRTMRLTANARQVRMRNFSIKLNCRDGSVLIDQQSGFEPSKIRRHKFLDTRYGSTDKVT